MNKKEILEYIKYNGKYSKEVKKKLNKLIKKYHPDKNKTDKTTILTLYEVKKDLENNNEVEIKTPKNDKSFKESAEFVIPSSLIERILKILSKQKRFIENKLKLIYRKEYYYNNKIYEGSNNVGLLDLKIEELNKKQIELKKLNKYDVIFLIFLIIIVICSIKYPILFILIVIPILFELLYLNYRSTIFYENNLLIESLEEKKRDYQEKQKDYYDNLSEIKKEELRLKKEKRVINNDIAFYNYELSKSNKNAKVNPHEKGNSYSKR